VLWMWEAKKVQENKQKASKAKSWSISW
jgi:hypothetical protein